MNTLLDNQIYCWAALGIGGLIAMVIGWKIHPYTVGELTKFVQSPIQQFGARCGTAIGCPILLVILVAPHIVDRFATKNDRLAKMEKEKQEVITELKNSVDPYDGGSANIQARADAVKKLAAIEAKKRELMMLPDDPLPKTSANNARIAPVESQDPRPQVDSTPQSTGEANRPKATPPSRGGNSSLSVRDASRLADDSKVKLAEMKGSRAALQSKIDTERARWQTATNTINRLTNNKRTPVQQGSQPYYQCLAASKVIQEVEAGAAELKAEKARLEATIKELEK